jgi:hypothetical protein
VLGEQANKSDGHTTPACGNGNALGFSRSLQARLLQLVTASTSTKSSSKRLPITLSMTCIQLCAALYRKVIFYG